MEPYPCKIPRLRCGRERRAQLFPCQIVYIGLSRQPAGERRAVEGADGEPWVEDRRLRLWGGFGEAAEQGQHPGQLPGSPWPPGSLCFSWFFSQWLVLQAPPPLPLGQNNLAPQGAPVRLACASAPHRLAAVSHGKLCNAYANTIRVPSHAAATNNDMAVDRSQQGRRAGTALGEGEEPSFFIIAGPSSGFVLCLCTGVTKPNASPALHGVMGVTGLQGMVLPVSKAAAREQNLHF